MKKIAILYHANCPDGFGGAWAAWKEFGNNADYIPVRYNMEPPPLKDKEIYFVDFCYNEDEFFERLKKDNRSITILDHHVTSKDKLKFADKYVFKMENSGAVISWKFFHPSKPVPLFLKYLEDMDLWKFRLSNSEEISAMFDFFPREFKKWSKLIQDFENSKKRKLIIEKGKLILAYNNALIRKMADKAAEIVQFQGYETYAVNSCILESELAYLAYEAKPPMSIIWYESKDGIKVSLRSNGKVDVAKIAEKFGGGGHKAASGFRLPKGAKFPWKSIKK